MLKRTIIRIYGLAVGINAAVSLLIAMILALFNPDHVTILDFNQYGEHYIEIVMFIAGIPCLIYLAVRGFKDN